MRQETKHLLTSGSSKEKTEGLNLLLRSQDYRLLPQAAALIPDKNRGVAELAKRVSLFLAESQIKKGGPQFSHASQALAAAIISAHHPDFIRNAFARLEDARLEAVIESIVCLRHFVDEEKAGEILQRFLNHPSHKVRATAALHVGLVAAKKNPAILIKYLEDADNRVRANTIEVIENLKNKGLVRVLDRFRNDRNNRVRANVLKALFALGAPDLRDDLKAMLTHEKSLMRTSAVWVIGEIGSKNTGCLELLKFVMEDTDELLCNNLIIVLKKVGEIPELQFLREKLDHEIKRRLKAKILKNSKLDLEPLDRDRYVLLKLSGSLTVDTILSFKLHLQEHIPKGRNEVVLDFREIEYIDSSAVALLANVSKKMNEGGGFFFIFGCNYRISEFFQLSRIDKTLSVFQTEEEIREFIYS